jgi:hypothetical protein
MRLHVVYDRSGSIVAAVRLDSATSNHPRPVVKEGHAAAEMEVPHEHAHLSFADVCHRLKVDTSGTKPILRPKGS